MGSNREVERSVGLLRVQNFHFSNLG